MRFGVHAAVRASGWHAAVPPVLCEHVPEVGKAPATRSNVQRQWQRAPKLWVGALLAGAMRKAVLRWYHRGRPLESNAVTRHVSAATRSPSQRDSPLPITSVRWSSCCRVMLFRPGKRLTGEHDQQLNQGAALGTSEGGVHSTGRRTTSG